MLFVPFYTIVFPLLGYHLQPVQAVQIGLFTEIFGFLSSATAFWRRGLIDFKIAGFALFFAIPTAIVGGYLANRLPGSWLLLIIGVALVSFAFLLLHEARASKEAETKTLDRPMRAIQFPVKQHRDRHGRVYTYRMQNDLLRATATFFGGLFQGLVGFAAGEVSTAEQVVRGVPVRLAVGNAHFIIAGASLAAAATHIAVVASEKGTIPWNILAASVPAVLIGGQIAGFIAGRLPQHVLQMVMARFLIFIGVISLYRAMLGLGWHLPPWLLLMTLLAFLASIVLYLAGEGNLIASGVSALAAASVARIRSRGCGSSCCRKEDEEGLP
ncbi:MAG: sulfite exporter TauE/SafE family protein [Ktedonobacteraceae bacterium]|nr:sulfite exporter TauE/SafE family protein [Ktedonobacteraceae bacterium]